MSPTSVAALRPAVSVDELRRAAAAVNAGAFRRAASRANVDQSTEPWWEPELGEQLVTVLGASGSVGATTTALAIAEASGSRARLVECAPPHASGIAAASTAELGIQDHGWRHGQRGGVLLQRTTESAIVATQVQPPTRVEDRDLTVLDISWDPSVLAAQGCWLSAAIASSHLCVIVGAATVPGLRRLESTVSTVDGRLSSLLVVTIGSPRARWPKPIQASIGPKLADIEAAGRLLTVAPDRDLAMRGLDSQPLPPVVRELGRTVLAHLDVQGVTPR